MFDDQSLALFERDAHNPSFDAIRSSGAFDGEPIDFCVPVNTYFPLDVLSGELLRDQLLTSNGCVVRECGNKVGSSSSYLRIAVRPWQDVDRLVGAIEDALPASTACWRRYLRLNAFTSVAALCRIMSR